jgi:hypothetical protein
MVIGLDNKSRTPTLPTLGGVVSNIEVNKSYVETDLNDVNFVTEGFLSRYYYKLVPKPTNFWAMLFKALAVFVVLAVAAVATIFTAGAAGIGLGAGLGAMLAGGGFTVGATIGTIGAIAGTAFAATGIGVGISAIALKVR